jgi:hypothetical protein
MIPLKPIPRRLLPDTAIVRVPDGGGGYEGGRTIVGVRFERAQSIVDDPHRSADAGAGKVYIDAVNSAGAFEVPAGSRIEIKGASLLVASVKRCEASAGRIHHWELSVR